MGPVAHMDFSQESAAKLQDGQAFQVVSSPFADRSGFRMPADGSAS